MSRSSDFSVLVGDMGFQTPPSEDSVAIRLASNGAIKRTNLTLVRSVADAVVGEIDRW